MRWVEREERGNETKKERKKELKDEFTTRKSIPGNNGKTQAVDCKLGD